MSLKYISDLHLFDVYSLGWRPNLTLEQFASELIHTWNQSTDSDDTVIIVGDIGYYCEKTIQTLTALNGSKVLVTGNHDVTWGNNLYTCGVFQGVYQQLDNNNLLVQHIPDFTYNKGYFIHGHHHRYDLPGMHNKLKLYKQNSCLLNCSTDLLNNKPMTLPELIMNKEIVLEKYMNRGII